MGNRFEFTSGINKGSFFFKGMEFLYHNHYHNATGMNERTVEIPLGLYYLEKYSGKDILEVGNVMHNYLTKEIKRDIVDKYEEDDKVTNIDIIDYNTDKKYDLILTISTIEHVGHCEEEKECDPTRGTRAVNKMTTLLKPGGLLFCTYPIGHNYNLDFAIRDKILSFDDVYCYKRESLDINHWTLTNFKTALETPEKGASIKVKSYDGEIYPVGIYYFLFVGLKYGGTE